MDDPVRYRVVVRGRVQGVWFRESCRRRAIELGVAGWVRNRADGTVEAEFEGAEADVAQAVAWCRVGPSAAEVAEIDVVPIEPTRMSGFAVR
jgi:acylphosphatase